MNKFSNIISKWVPLSKRIIALTLAVWLTSSVAIAQPGGKGGKNQAKPYRLVVIDNRQTGTYANNIADINDAISAHRVQIIGKAGTYSKGSGSLFVGNWAIWEENAPSVVLLKDVTNVPTDSSYDFTATTEFNSINDSSWIGGGIARGPDRVRVPAILIRQ